MNALLHLARVSNLPTVWTNTLAGALIADPFAAPIELAGLCLLMSLFYAGGMVLNDVFDAAHDARERPERPLPAGLMGRRPAAVAGAAMLIAGVAGLALFSAAAGITGALLAGGILLYDAHHKGVSWAPLVMAGCRFLVYPAAALALAPNLDPHLLAIAGITATWTLVLTLIARRPAPAHGRGLDVGTLIAAICLLDAVYLLAAGLVLPGLLASVGFPLTRWAQRHVSGT